MIEGLLGVFTAISIIAAARKQNLSHWLYSVALISLPIIYIFFGALSGDLGVVFNEIVYGLPFIISGSLCLIFGFKASGYFLASLWLAHGAYDIYHDVLFINSGVPSWYPVFCAVVDAGVGLYLFYSVFKLPNLNIKETDSSR